MSRDIPKVKPSDTQRLSARRLLRGARAASLATTSADGAPYASLVTMATDHAGAPVLLLSGLAEHTRNLQADPRCALLVEDASFLPNPQTGPRVTVTGRAAPVAEGPLRDHLASRFQARHPGAALYAGFADFAIWRLAVERVHLVGGFARAVWLDRVLLDAPTAEAFAAAEASVVNHMNLDHASAVDAYARGLLGLDEGPWRLRAVDADGLDLGRPENATPDSEDGRVHRLAFDPPVESPDHLRERLVALARQARNID